MTATAAGMNGLVQAHARAAYTSDGEQEAALNTQGAQLFAQSLPDYTEISRMGNSAFVIGGTAVAPVAAVPTTAAHFTLWNGEQVGGKSYAIDYIGSIVTTSAGAVIVLSLLVHNGSNQTTVKPTISNAATPNGLNGSTYRGLAYGGGSGTIVQSSSWHPAPIVVPSVVCAGTANIGLTVGGDVRGRYIVPPGAAFSMASFCSSAGSATCQLFAIWHEVQIVNN